MQEVNSRALGAKYCIVGIPHNTATVYYNICKSDFTVEVKCESCLGMFCLYKPTVMIGPLCALCTPHLLSGNGVCIRSRYKR